MTTLDPVQHAAIAFARGKPGVGWFIQQGLGKSLTALTEFAMLHAQMKVDRMIVVCPNSFKSGWLDEIEKHGLKFDAHVFESAKKTAVVDWLRREHRLPPVLIVNYEAARMVKVIPALVKWAQAGKTYLAIDESIALKGPWTAQTKAVHKLAAWNPYRPGEPLVCRYIRLLTGRPQTQGPHDLWGQLRAIGLFQDRNFIAFRGMFCEMGGWENKVVMAAKNTQMLARIMAPVVFQAKKADWLPSLPRKDYTIRDYTMSLEQIRQYTQMERDFLIEVERGVITVDVAIAKYEKLAQIMTGFVYDAQHGVHALVEPEANPRLQLLLELLAEEVEGKTVVVYRHQAVFDILLEALLDYAPAWIRGEMTANEVAAQKAAFNGDPRCRVLLAQAEATKFGHTLLGDVDSIGPDDKCRTMIFFENSYSADTRDQVEDRIHRRGQTGERVLYIDLSGSPLDRRIVKALQRKDALYASVFSHLKAAEPEPVA